MTTHTITIPIKEGTKTLNANHRHHWAKKADLTRLWVALGRYHAQNAKIPRGITKAQVDVYVYRKDNRRYDPMNLYPTFKAFVDGMTLYGAWEDDDAEHVAGPFIHHGGVDKENPRFEIRVKVLA